MNNNLILRTLNSPYGDTTKGTVLSQGELDDNFLYLKGQSINSINNSNDILFFNRINGDVLTAFTTTTPTVTSGSYSNGTATFYNSTGTSFTISGFYTGATDVYVTGGTYDSLTGVAEFTNNTGGTFTLSGYYVPVDLYWTAGSSGTNSITVVGPTGTDATGSFSVAEGINNQVDGASSYVGGFQSVNNGDISFLHAVNSIITIGDSSTILGGQSNTIGVNASTNKENSIINGDNSTITGGCYTNNITSSSNVGITDSILSNIVNSSGSMIGVQYQSGIYNSDVCTITDNTESAYNNIIIGGWQCGITGALSSCNILGGQANQITGSSNSSSYSTITNGAENKVFDSYGSSILNGLNNKIINGSIQSTIINGQNHQVLASYYASILGGETNYINESNGSAIIGGQFNSIISDGVTGFTRYYNGILGGYNNTVDNSELCYIIGGYENVIPYGIFGSVILGGDSITATTSNTVYVQRLNIKYIPNDNTTTKILTVNASGQVSYRTITSLSGGTGSGGTTDMFWDTGTTGTYSLKAVNDSGNDALADYSYSEGHGGIAEGYASHVEGTDTSAIGNSAHAQNFETEAHGDYTHAGGYQSIASGLTSFIHSTNSNVTGTRSAVIGGRNIGGTADDTVYVPNLNINYTPTTGSTSTNILVRNGGGVVETRNDGLFRTKLQYLGETSDNSGAQYDQSSTDTVEYVYRCVNGVNIKTGKFLLSYDSDGSYLNYAEYGVEQWGDCSGIDIYPIATPAHYRSYVYWTITSGTWNIYLTRIVY